MIHRILCFALLSILFSSKMCLADYNPFLLPGTPVITLSGIDNGPAINTALASVAAGHSPAPVRIIQLPGGGNPTFSTPIVNANVVQVITDGCLTFTGSGANAWTEGQTGVKGIPASFAQSNVCVQRSSVNWTDQYAGIKLYNPYQRNISLSASNFYIGVDDYADTGSYYNLFTLGQFFNNRIPIRLYATGSTGVPNQSTFIGGRFSSSAVSSLDTYGIVLESNNSQAIDGNVFINPDFEIHKDTTGDNGNVEAVHCVSDSGTLSVGTQNRMFGARVESSVTVGSGAFYFLGGTGCYRNTFELTYGYPVFSGAATNSAVTWLHPADTTGSELQLISNGITGTGDIGQGIPGLTTFPIVDRNSVVMRNNSGTDTLERAGDGVFWTGANSGSCSAGYCTFGTEQSAATLSARTIQIGTGGVYAYGRVFDLRGNNVDFTRLIQITSTSSVAGGRVVVVAFDASGNILTNSSSPLPCCGTISSTGFSWVSGNEWWAKSADLPAGRYTIPIALDPTVAFVFIGIKGGTVISNLENMTISVNPQSNIIPLGDNSVIGTLGGMICADYCQILPHYPTSVAIPAPPASGNDYQSGEIAWNVNPQSGNVAPISWTFTGHASAASATMTCASPSVFSLTNAFRANQPIVLGGTPCTGFTAGTTYYVISSGLTTSAFELSATSGGAAINGTGTSSGLTVSAAWSPGPNLP